MKERMKRTKGIKKRRKVGRMEGNRKEKNE